MCLYDSSDFFGRFGGFFFRRRSARACRTDQRRIFKKTGRVAPGLTHPGLSLFHLGLTCAVTTTHRLDCLRKAQQGHFINV